MQALLNEHPFLFLSTNLVAIWVLICALISYAGGWHSLAKRFRMKTTFRGQTWKKQSGKMRGIANYNRSLKFGSNEDGLYLESGSLFWLWHPQLFIPWSEIAVERKRVWILHSVTLRLGSMQPIPLTVNNELAESLRHAAGSAWPEKAEEEVRDAT